MAFQFKGRGVLKRIDKFQANNGRVYLTLIFEENGQYPQTIPIKIFSRVAEESGTWTPGITLEVHGRLGGREVGERVFGEAVAESVEVIYERSAGKHRNEKAGNGKGGWGDDSPPPDDSDNVPF